MNLKHDRVPQLIPNLKTAASKDTVEVRITALEDGGAVGSNLDTRLTAAEGEIDTLQGQVATATTGLLDRATALEARKAFTSGAGAPSDLNGANGDLYLRTSDSSFYLKAAGTWTSMGTLVPAI